MKNIWIEIDKPNTKANWFGYRLKVFAKNNIARLTVKEFTNSTYDKYKLEYSTKHSQDIEALNAFMKNKENYISYNFFNEDKEASEIATSLSGVLEVSL